MPAKLKSPFFASMIGMPTVDEEGCVINVIAAPINAPGNGSSVFFYHSEKQASSFKGSTAFSTVNNPKNSKPKYNMILSVFFTFSVFETSIKINPITKSIKKNFHLSIAIICLLTVVANVYTENNPHRMFKIKYYLVYKYYGDNNYSR